MSIKLLDAGEVAKALGLTKPRIYQLTRDGFFPFAIKLGLKGYRYSDAGLATWLLNGGNLQDEKQEVSDDDAK